MKRNMKKIAILGKGIIRKSENIYNYEEMVSKFNHNSNVDISKSKIWIKIDYLDIFLQHLNNWTYWYKDNYFLGEDDYLQNSMIYLLKEINYNSKEQSPNSTSFIIVLNSWINSIKSIDEMKKYDFSNNEVDLIGISPKDDWSNLQEQDELIFKIINSSKYTRIFYNTEQDKLNWEKCELILNKEKCELILGKEYKNNLWKQELKDI